MSQWTREQIQYSFIRTCRDSGFRMDYARAAIFTGELLEIQPLEIWTAFGTLSVMEKISKNNHPAVQRMLDNPPDFVQ